MTERFSPSWVSQLRCSSRPVATTRMPFFNEAATLSASCRQHTMLKKLVRSSHSFVCWLRHERLTATPKVAVEMPLAVYRISGSRVRLPTTVIELVLLAMGSSLRVLRRGATSHLRRSVDLLRNAQHLVTDDFICKGERPVQLVHRRGLRPRLEDHVVALGAVADLVGEATLAPPVDVPALGTPGFDELQPPFDGGADRLLFQVRLEDDHDLVRPRHGPVPPSDRSRIAGMRALLDIPRARARKGRNVRCEPGEASSHPVRSLGRPIAAQRTQRVRQEAGGSGGAGADRRRAAAAAGLGLERVAVRALRRVDRARRIGPVQARLHRRVRDRPAVRVVPDDVERQRRARHREARGRVLAVDEQHAVVAAEVEHAPQPLDPFGVFVGDDDVQTAATDAETRFVQPKERTRRRLRRAERPRHRGSALRVRRARVLDAAAQRDETEDREDDPEHRQRQQDDVARAVRHGGEITGRALPNSDGCRAAQVRLISGSRVVSFETLRASAIWSVMWYVSALDGKRPARTSATNALTASVATASSAAYFRTNFGTLRPSGVKPSRSCHTSTCPSQCRPAPMPIVGTDTVSVTMRATPSGTASSTIAKQPASASATASSTNRRAASSCLPCT